MGDWNDGMSKEALIKHIKQSQDDTQYVLIEITHAPEWLGFAALAVHDSVGDTEFLKGAIAYAYNAICKEE